MTSTTPGGILGPVTNATRRRWQHTAYELLGEFLALAREHDLPVITWIVSEYSVVGECHQRDMSDRERAFQAWVGALRLERRAEVAGSGMRSLRASAERRGNGSVIEVGVTADLLEEAEES
jgi:hypothetical protein